ncbi:hypothetical protein M885DRAFT_509336 [Pelagophyceae sp. CCMP2097]|nr:hypothetical protein M885DRAFT_509336 [Pelagophyceae sp. CCMP2097]
MLSRARRRQGYFLAQLRSRTAVTAAVAGHLRRRTNRSLREALDRWAAFRAPRQAPAAHADRSAARTALSAWREYDAARRAASAGRIEAAVDRGLGAPLRALQRWMDFCTARAHSNASAHAAARHRLARWLVVWRRASLRRRRAVSARSFALDGASRRALGAWHISARDARLRMRRRRDAVALAQRGAVSRAFSRVWRRVEGRRLLARGATLDLARAGRRLLRRWRRRSAAAQSRAAARSTRLAARHASHKLLAAGLVSWRLGALRGRVALCRAAVAHRDRRAAFRCLAGWADHCVRAGGRRSAARRAAALARRRGAGRGIEALMRHALRRIGSRDAENYAAAAHKARCASHCIFATIRCRTH